MTFSRAMSSFFSCFCVKPDRHRRAPRTPEVSGFRNRLSSLFLSEGEEVEELPHKSGARKESTWVGKDLKNQAKFLKNSGTIPKTPVEIKQASDRFKGDGKLQVDESSDQSINPVKLQEKLAMDFRSTDFSPSRSSIKSCISSVQTSGRISTGSTDRVHGKSANTVIEVQTRQFKDNPATLPPLSSVENTRCKNKSVQFICEDDLTNSTSSSSEKPGQDSAKCKTPGNQSEFKPLPSFTPLKLDDAMQTPGTVYPANLENNGNDRARIRSQFVYSVPNTMEHPFQLKSPKGEDPNSDLFAAEPKQSLGQRENATLQAEKWSNSMSAVDESMVDPSLQEKTAPSMEDGYDRCGEPVSAEKSHIGKTHGDRPIIGIVATHWNDDYTSTITPKWWWEGNGIPNSTNKYKEDQKVSWHATPFEERLEKALSEETLISLRNTGRPIVLDENEENDTAISKRQFSPPSNLAVSC